MDEISFCPVSSTKCRRNSANSNGGRGDGGGQNQPRVLETLIYKKVKLEKAGRWFEATLSIHTPLSLTLIQIFFYLPPTYS